MSRRLAALLLLALLGLAPQVALADDDLQAGSVLPPTRSAAGPLRIVGFRTHVPTAMPGILGESLFLN